MRKPVRKSLRDTIAEHQRVMDYYAMMTNKPRVDLRVPEVKQRAAPKPSGNPTEAQVLKAVLAFLRAHPKVASIWRQNSGTFAEQNRDGSTRYVRANTARGMADVMGFLKDGRVLAIECKSLTGRLQPHQKEFLDKITAAGGVAGVARSVDDAIALLNGA